MGNQPSDRKNVRGDAGITAGGDVYIENKGRFTIGKDIRIERDFSDSKRITEEKYGSDAMIGGAKIHEKLKEFISRNYKNVEDLEIESHVYNSDSGCYEVTLNYKRTGDAFSECALAKVDPYTGEIIGFKKGLNRDRFLAVFK